MAESVDNHQHPQELPQEGNKDNQVSSDNAVIKDQQLGDQQNDEKHLIQKNTDSQDDVHNGDNNNVAQMSVDPSMNIDSNHQGFQTNEQVNNDLDFKQNSDNNNNKISSSNNVKTNDINNTPQDDGELSPQMKRSSLKGSSQTLSAHNQGEFSNQDSLGRMLGESRRSRKQAELEAAVLAGRLGLLRQEEINSRRKIFQTKKQTYEYFILKQTNEMNQSQKNQNNQDEEQKLQQRREENERHRTSKRNDRDLARNTILEANKTSYINIKKNQEINEQKKRDIEESSLKENQRKKELVLQQKLKASSHIAKYKNKQAEIFMQNYNQWIEEEEQIKQFKKQQIQQMEQLELNMIKKLQATQILQRKAFEELQGIIQMPSEKFNETYHPIFKKKNVNKLILSATNAALNQQRGQQKNEGDQDKNKDDNANTNTNNNQIIHIEGNEEENGGVNNKQTNDNKKKESVSSVDDGTGNQQQDYYSLTERVRETQSVQVNQLHDNGKLSSLTERGQNNQEQNDNMLRQSALSDRKTGATKGTINNNNKKVKKTRKKLPSGVTLSSSKAFVNQPGLLKDIYLPNKNRS